jgi:predicted outer membrane protein
MVVAMALLGATGACQRGEPEAPPVQTPTVPEPAPLEPGERLAVVAVIHAEGFELGEAGTVRSESSDVQRLAAVMAEDHRGIAEAIDSVAIALGIRTVPDSRPADSLRSDLEEIRGRTLVPGTLPFDSLYLRAAAAFYGRALEGYERALRGSGASELMAVLRDARTTMEAHMRRIQQLAAGVTPPPAPPEPEPEPEAAPAPVRPPPAAPPPDTLPPDTLGLRTPG